MIPLYRYNWKLETWEKDSHIEYDPSQQLYSMNMVYVMPNHQSYFFSGGGDSYSWPDAPFPRVETKPETIH
jgi:hypothetical protein